MYQTRQKGIHKQSDESSGPALDHPAAPLLSEYAKYGCPPVDCGPNWTCEQIDEALEYRAHPTAKIPAALECLITKEAEEKEKEGFIHIL